jgi:hypothetical protein
MRKVYVDTAVLLSDFFYRFPEFAHFRQQNVQDENKLVELRQKVHENLLRLSLEQNVMVFTSVPVLVRFAALLGEYKVEKRIIEEEMQHWLSNLQILEVSLQDLEKAFLLFSQPEREASFDEILSHEICLRNQIQEQFLII